MIEGNMKVVIYDNKTGQQFDESDMISKDSFLEYEILTPEEYKILQDKKV